MREGRGTRLARARTTASYARRPNSTLYVCPPPLLLESLDPPLRSLYTCTYEAALLVRVWLNLKNRINRCPLNFQSGNMGRRNPFSAASKATGLHSGRFYTKTRLSAGECKSNLTTQVLVAPALIIDKSPNHRDDGSCHKAALNYERKDGKLTTSSGRLLHKLQTEED